jgi:hypothetical protein
MSKSALLAVVLASREPASRFTADELRVLVNLAEHLNDDTGQCNPGRNRLATETGIDRSNVRRILLALEERGEIARVGTTKGGRREGDHGNAQRWELPLKGDWQWQPPSKRGDGARRPPWRDDSRGEPQRQAVPEYDPTDPNRPPFDPAALVEWTKRELTKAEADPAWQAHQDQLKERTARLAAKKAKEDQELKEQWAGRPDPLARFNQGGHGDPLDPNQGGNQGGKTGQSRG